MAARLPPPTRGDRGRRRACAGRQPHSTPTAAGAAAAVAAVANAVVGVAGISSLVLERGPGERMR